LNRLSVITIVPSAALLLGVVACTLRADTPNPLYFKQSGIWSHTYFAVDSNGLEFACDNGPLNWNGGDGSCFYAGSISNDANSPSQKVQFIACPPGSGCQNGGHIHATIYEDANGNLIIKLPPGGTVQVVH
jgi:hypothetical protein